MTPPEAPPALPAEQAEGRGLASTGVVLDRAVKRDVPRPGGLQVNTADRLRGVRWPRATAPRLLVVGVSARLLAEAAQREGHPAWALDLFGDTDTRAAAVRWDGAGDAATLRLDGTRVLAALREAAHAPGCLGWVAGSGFDGQADLLQAAAGVLPLIGTAPAAQRRVRDARDFFGTLTRLGARHPALRFDAPPDPRGWLVKQMDGCGGTHIRRAEMLPRLPHLPHASQRPVPHRLWQRRVDGTPMSVLFVANGRQARRLAFNRLIVREQGASPCVYHGAIGPVALGARAAAELDALVDTLAAAFDLQGLCSLDLMLDDEQHWTVLELNPRPSASMALYPQAGLLQIHLDACLRQRLPAAPLTLADAALAGHEIVFAPAPLRFQAPADRSACHDMPREGSAIPAGAPVCSVSARGADVATTLAALAARRDAVLHAQPILETCR